MRAFKQEEKYHQQRLAEIAAIRKQYPKAAGKLIYDERGGYIAPFSLSIWINGNIERHSDEISLILPFIEMPYQFNNNNYTTAIKSDKKKLVLCRLNFDRNLLYFEPQYQKLHSEKLRAKCEKSILTFYRKHTDVKIKSKFAPPNVQKLINFA